MKAATLTMVKRSRTNFPGLKLDGSGSGANRLTHQMCLIHRDFKHFRRPKATDSPRRGKVSSIMCAKVLSIMRTGDVGLTSLFKPKRTWL